VGFNSAFNGLRLFQIQVNIWGGSVHTVKENTEALVVAGKETGLQVNVDNTKHRVMSRYQNAG